MDYITKGTQNRTIGEENQDILDQIDRLEPIERLRLFQTYCQKCGRSLMEMAYPVGECRGCEFRQAGLYK